MVPLTVDRARLGAFSDKINPMRKTLLAKTESRLAALQARQVGNTCSFHAIAAALRLLLDLPIDPAELSDEVDRLWRRGRFMRVWPGWAVTPRMQARIVRHLAKTRDLPVTADYRRGNPDLLPDLLADPAGGVPLVTLIWLWGQAPPIYHGDSADNHNQTRKAGGHTMILAAYDPAHQIAGHLQTPWGLINPWVAGSDALYWMADPDFRRAWRFRLPGSGPNPLVIIKRKAPDDR